jgi:hypothetical protein
MGKVLASAQKISFLSNPAMNAGGGSWAAESRPGKIIGQKRRFGKRFGAASQTSQLVLANSRPL